MWRLYCLYRYGVQLLSVDDVAVITAIKRQGAFHVAFATVHRRSRRPQMTAIARPNGLRRPNAERRAGRTPSIHQRQKAAISSRSDASECATSREELTG